MELCKNSQDKLFGVYIEVVMARTWMEKNMAANRGTILLAVCFHCFSSNIWFIWQDLIEIYFLVYFLTWRGNTITIPNRNHSGKLLFDLSIAISSKIKSGIIKINTRKMKRAEIFLSAILTLIFCYQLTLNTGKPGLSDKVVSSAKNVNKSACIGSIVGVGCIVCHFQKFESIKNMFDKKIWFFTFPLTSSGTVNTHCSSGSQNPSNNTSWESEPLAIVDSLS